MKKCKKCGAELTDNAKVCPNCSTKVGSGKKVLVFILIAIIVLAIIGAVSGGDSEGQPNTPGVSQGADENKDSGNKVDLSNVAKEYTLSAGYYTAGVDIPAGKCDVVAVSGTGNLSSSNLWSGGINEMFGVDDGSGFYTESFKGLELPEDATLEVSGNLKIKLTYSELKSNYTGRTYDESAAVTLGSGNYTVGSDLKEGTYKLIAVSGNGNISSSDLYNGGINEVFGIDDSSGYYTKEFQNLDLEKDVVVEIKGNLKVKFIPAK